MNILMLSIDRALVGDPAAATDAIKRHRAYASGVYSLRIVVPTTKGFESEQLADNLFVYPTNSSSRIKMFKDSIHIAMDLYKKEKIDLVVAQHYAAPIAKKIAKKINTPYLVSFHAANIDPPVWIPKGVKWVWSAQLKSALKDANRIRVVSPGVKEYIANTAKINKKRITVIPTPVDTKMFSNADEQEVSMIRAKWEDKKTILFVGRLEEEKNIPLLIEAMGEIVKKYPNSQCIIIGEGSLKEELIEKTKRLSLEKSILFLGAIQSNDLPKYYHAADMFVLPSHTESLGKVLIEAGVAQCPLIATKTTGAKFLLKHKKTGLLIKNNNKKDLVESIELFLSDNKLSTKLGAAAKEDFIKRFDVKKTTQNIITMWHDTAKGI